MNKREAVLVVLHADGWAEVYADKSVDVHVAVKPFAWNAVMGQLAEDYLDLTLPRRYQRLYLPVNLRGVGLCEQLMPTDLVKRDRALEALAALKELQPNKSKEEDAVWSL